ncbi:Formate hydrogenlyase subunit 4 [Sporobacter termitidis DSM 10068]|uniref:Formate hydrogenlyase subunit 4 n=1 Tax=Sporobacter termitidis DSM 10068 TaxID=1123282 RepID=A0A1M5Z0G7_9FIRM|nr:complex I subunit 1 family protein [Sporobacter termitidis]SHI17785.1 Formate hydrogenlyase subunit 4 [Sporobacter termitidis DSM 10068]
MKILLTTVLFIILAPVAGGLLSGFDRKISARMQKRVGPSILQPFYDVLKLFQKENVVVNISQNLYAFCFLFFTVFTGVLFFNGADILLIIFSLTLAGIFFVLGGYSTFSPYSFIGSERELLSMVADEPMIILTAVGMYMVTKSFSVADIAAYGTPLFFYIPGVFLGFLFILTIKLKKSPFDLSTSHHAHQELVSGVTTEFSGKPLAWIELAHWYENVFLLGIVYLFFAPVPVIGVAVALLAYFLEIFIDNINARVKWQWMLKSAWGAAIGLGVLNIFILYIVQ